jgi:hypothetical protein
MDGIYLDNQTTSGIKSAGRPMFFNVVILQWLPNQFKKERVKKIIYSRCVPQNAEC